MACQADRPPSRPTLVLAATVVTACLAFFLLIAEDVLDKIYELLTPELRAKLPAARAAFAKRCEAVWGTSMAGAARTPIPDL